MSSFIKFRIDPKPPVEKSKEKKPEKYNIDKVNRKLKVYCVYFPQFHSFIENDTNFYPGYTDITNLQLLIKEKPSTHYLTPSLKELGLSKMSDYDLVKKQKSSTKSTKNPRKIQP